MLSSTANYITPLPFMILKQYVEKLELFMAWSEALIVSYLQDQDYKNIIIILRARPEQTARGP